MRFFLDIMINWRLVMTEINKLVDYIFANFAILCRGFDELYTDIRRLETEKKIWVSSFARQNITYIAQIKAGIIKLESHTYYKPPQLGEFVKWCNPSAQTAGLLSPDKAYMRSHEFLRGESPNDLSEIQIMLIKHAITESDPYFLKTNSREKAEPLFKRNYEITVRDHLEDNLRPIPKAIEAPDNSDPWKTLRYYDEAVKTKFDHLKGYEDSMPIIRKLLGVKPDGQMPNNSIGRTMQRIIDKNSKEAMRESAFDSNQTDE